MEKRKNRPIWALFIIFLVIVLIGMTCEFSLKLANSLLNKRETNPPQIIVNQILRGFGDEAIPLWAIPTLVLNWMSVMPRNSVIYALRWLPYLGLFLLPVLCALIRKRSIPLIICAAVNGIVAVGIMLVHFSSCYRAGYPDFNSVSRGGMPAFAASSFLPLLSLLFVYLF